MYGVFTYIWLLFMVNVGKYTIHWASGIMFCRWFIFKFLSLQKNHIPASTSTIGFLFVESSWNFLANVWQTCSIASSRWWHGFWGNVHVFLVLGAHPPSMGYMIPSQAIAMFSDWWLQAHSRTWKPNRKRRQKPQRVLKDFGGLVRYKWLVCELKL